MSLLFKSTPTNVLNAMLSYLHVKHTKLYSNKLFNEHPHKDNLYGISKMLSDYGIENIGTRIENIEENLLDIETPFIAYKSNDFYAVSKVTPEKVHYNWRGKEVITEPEHFVKGWQNIVLLAGINKDSIEPNYKENLKKEIINITEKWILLFIISIIISGIYYHMQLYKNVGITLLLFVNLIGIIVGWLLVQKQMNYNSAYTDRLCSLLNIGDCNDILETEAAKLWGIISWSTIGFGYFISNVLLILIESDLLNFLAVLNIFTLPYTIWSIWYQKFKAKQWCTLCLSVQFLLWIIFFISLFSNSIQTLNLNAINIIQVGSIYLVPIILINIITKYLSKGNETENVKHELNSIKANEKVFLSLLKEQPKFNAGLSASSIIWGNPNSKLLITVITNPFCNPCAQMHPRIERVLEETKYNLCIQYIFTHFAKHKELENGDRFLISTYLQKSFQEAKEIYKNWFSYGRNNWKEYIKNFDHDLDINSIKSEKEFQKHKNWLNSNKIHTTPTILINGYKLPGNYKIEDLKYFTNLDFH